MCRRNVAVMYRGMRTLGKKHFNAFNIKREYLDLFPGKEATATSGKCPARYLRIGEHKGKQLCRSKRKTSKISKRSCQRKNKATIKGGDCIIKKKGWYLAQALR
jgi:hypothetical protein